MPFDSDVAAEGGGGCDVSPAVPDENATAGPARGEADLTVAPFVVLLLPLRPRPAADTGRLCDTLPLPQRRFLRIG